MVSRNVILICGPPGAGKTTHAHTLGLPVYDIDDPQWHNNSTPTKRPASAASSTGARSHPPLHAQIAAVKAWWNGYEPDLGQASRRW